MFKNLIKTSVRSIFQNKLYLTINVIGLTIGFVALFFIANYISNELSYDKFNKNYNKIYRLSGDEDIEMPAMYGPMIKNEFPEIKEYARFYIEKAALIYNKEPFYLSDFVYTDNNSPGSFNCRAACFRFYSLSRRCGSPCQRRSSRRAEQACDAERFSSSSGSGDFTLSCQFNRPVASSACTRPAASS